MYGYLGVRYILVLSWSWDLTTVTEEGNTREERRVPVGVGLKTIIRN